MIHHDDTDVGEILKQQSGELKGGFALLGMSNGKSDEVRDGLVITSPRKPDST
jgi:hypothetical protein